MKENYCVENWEWSATNTNSIFICTAAEDGFVTCEFYAGGQDGGPCIHGKRRFEDICCYCAAAKADSQRAKLLRDKMDEL